MRRDVLLGALAAAALATSAAPPASAASDLAVVAGHLVAGGRQVGPSVVLVRDGRIVAVTAGDAAPENASILDARSLWVVPGLVDARSGAGLPRPANEEAAEVTPAFTALDLVDSSSPDFDEAIAGGVTTVAVAPGGRAVIGGLLGVLKTAPGRLEERTLSREAGLSITLGLEPPLGNRLARSQTPRGLHFRRPGNRMGVVAEVRRTFALLREGEIEDAGAARVLRAAVERRLPAFLRARTESDILAALRLAEEHGLLPVLVDATEAHRVPEEIAASKAACVLGPLYQQPRDFLELWEGEDVKHGTAKALHEAGVVVAIGTGPDEPPGSLRGSALLAARAGLPEDAALDAITRVPARLLGVSHRVGDVAPGLDGDLVVLDGPPLDARSRVVAVVVSGKVVLRDPKVTLSLAAATAAPPARPEEARP